MKNDHQSLDKVLCSSFGPWEVAVSMNPSMKMKLTFGNTGNIMGTLFAWNHIPQQAITGNWQLNGDILYISYTYNIPNPNFFGQIVSWMPSTQNVTLNVSSFSSDRIHAVQVANNGYNTNYQWFFSSGRHPMSYLR